MGNSTSSQSLNSPSVRSRTSRKSRSNGTGEPTRLSQAVSFYQTPPGSFDLGKRPISTTSTDFGNVERQSSNSDAGTESLPEKEKATEMKQMKWKPGVYSLVNVHSETVLDLSGADDTSLIGFPGHNGKNQQWCFESLGDGWMIRSVSSGQYLTSEHATDGSLSASAFPMSWKVAVVSEGEEVVIRILWPNERMAVALADSGSKAAGTKVHLTPSSIQENWQSWRLIERAPAEAHIVRSQEAAASSTPVESVVITEDDNAVTTTRTTTTSTVTTVTTVTKMPIRAGTVGVST